MQRGQQTEHDVIHPTLEQQRAALGPAAHEHKLRYRHGYGYGYRYGLKPKVTIAYTDTRRLTVTIANRPDRWQSMAEHGRAMSQYQQRETVLITVDIIVAFCVTPSTFIYGALTMRFGS